MPASDPLALCKEGGSWKTIATGIHSALTPNRGCPPDWYTRTVGQGTHQQILTGAQNVSIGSLSSTNVGGNYTKHVSIIQHTYPDSLTSEGGDRIPRCSPYEIVNWLKAPNFRPIQQTALAQRMLDTGIWFIESAEFQNFTEHKGSRLWGTGMRE